MNHHSYLATEDTTKGAIVLQTDHLHNIIHRPSVQIFVRKNLKRQPILEPPKKKNPLDEKKKTLLFKKKKLLLGVRFF